MQTTPFILVGSSNAVEQDSSTSPQEDRACKDLVVSAESTRAASILVKI